MVFAGQGIVGFAAGWLAGGGVLAHILEPTGLAGGMGGAAIAAGIYPLTQFYQLADDERRSDMTLARWLGTKDSFSYVMLLLGAGGGCVVFVFSQKGFLVESAMLTAYFLGVLIYLAQFSKRLSRLASLQVYRRVMLFNYTNSTLLLVPLSLHLWGRV
jgi:1,4-dihydroxy-2-naphthoate octaprenyltransferase